MGKEAAVVPSSGRCDDLVLIPKLAYLVKQITFPATLLDLMSSNLETFNATAQ